MGTADGFVARARRDLGMTEHPPGSNHNSNTVWYNEHVDRIGDGPWCDMSVSRWAAESGNGDAVGAFAYTVYHAQWFQKQGRWRWGTKGIRKGDVVFFDWGGSRSIGRIDHVGIVEKVSGSIVYTIEANIGDTCKRVARDSAYIVGHGRPAFNGVGGSAIIEGEDMLGLKKGDKGPRVRLLQLIVKSAGGKLPKYGADSDYGDETAAAVRAVRIAAGSDEAKTDKKAGDEITPQTLQQIWWEFVKKAAG